MGKDAIETIRYFGSQKRIYIVDFRNVSAPIPEGGFVETYMDDGYMNMFRVMRALREVNYDGMVWSDHLPQMVEGAMRRRHSLWATCAPWYRRRIRWRGVRGITEDAELPRRARRREDGETGR